MDMICTGLFPVKVPIEYHSQLNIVFKRELPMRIVSATHCEVLVMWNEYNTAQAWVEQNVEE